MQIQLDANQAQVLVNLLDIAVKSAGLSAAESVVFFTKTIQDASRVEQEAAIQAQAEAKAAAEKATPESAAF